MLWCFQFSSSLTLAGEWVRNACSRLIQPLFSFPFMLGKQERGEEGKKSYFFLWGLPISYSSWRFFKEFGSMEGVMLKQNLFLFFFCFIPWGDISPLLFYWSAAACCSLVLGVSMLTKCLSVNFSLECFLDKLASSVILVVVSSCVFLLDIKSVLSQCLGTHTMTGTLKFFVVIPPTWDYRCQVSTASPQKA